MSKESQNPSREPDTPPSKNGSQKARSTRKKTSLSDGSREIDREYALRLIREHFSSQEPLKTRNAD